MKIFLWGTGKISEEIIRNCTSLREYEILGFIDNNPEKIGRPFYGWEVFHPDVLEKNIPDKIVILTDAEGEIKKQIEENYPVCLPLAVGKNFFYQESLVKRYAGTEDTEILELFQYIEKKGLDIFNYPFTEKYYNMQIDVFFDEEYQMYYVFHYGKQMYFPKYFDNEEQVKDYYRFILLEQDMESPHRYLDETFCIEEGNVVVDAGVAEGNFSLENIDKISKLYLIEADIRWIEALKITFREYADKVTIIHAFVSSYDEGSYARLDSLIPEQKVDFIKMDIEGNEWDGLQGAETIIKNSNGVKLAICAYHSDFDQTLIEGWMDKMNIEHSTTRGYMWYPALIRQNYISLKFNRAIVRGIKKN